LLGSCHLYLHRASQYHRKLRFSFSIVVIDVTYQSFGSDSLLEISQDGVQDAG
jgi:hypothetical protein